MQRFRIPQPPVWLFILLLIGVLVVKHAWGAESTAQRDAPTTRFYDARGNATGTATTDTQGTTVFRDSRGNTVGRAYRK